MKYKTLILFVIVFVMLILVACSNNSILTNVDESSEKSTGKIYLYGEQHGVEKILEKELELWSKYYHEENMRHLFVELPYYTAEFLNIWMQVDGDDILDELFEEWKNTQSYKACVKEFYKKIKRECPETVFHGNDVGHQYHTTGQRFLKYLEENNLKDTEKYILAKEAIEQGKYFYENSDHIYRENKMAENFIREFDKLQDENIMGIYGSAHTDFNAMDYYNKSVPCMANQLKKRYGDAIYSENLSYLAEDSSELSKVVDPIRVDIITINGKDYEASYFGKQDMNGFNGYAYREYWRQENAYDDFKYNKKVGNVLPYTNYIMQIETGKVFVIDYTKLDGSVKREYHRSDGRIWNDLPVTEEFIIE